MEMVWEVARHRGLLGMLAWRDIRVRYKQSVLGFAWAFIMPLVQTLVLFAIFTYGPVQINDVSQLKVPYFLFVLSGVVAWGLTAGSINGGIDSLTRNSRLVTKIYFPREVFPLASIVSSLVDFGIASLLLLPFYIYFAIRGQVHPSAMLLLAIPVLLIQVTFLAGVALILSMANLFFRDVKYIMTVVLQLWFFATNVFYPIEFKGHPGLAWIGRANPMIPIFSAYRDILAGRAIEDVLGLSIAAGLAVVVLVFGWRMFHRAEFKFAEFV